MIKNRVNHQRNDADGMLNDAHRLIGDVSCDTLPSFEDAIGEILIDIQDRMRQPHWEHLLAQPPIGTAQAQPVPSDDALEKAYVQSVLELERDPRGPQKTAP